MTKNQEIVAFITEHIPWPRQQFPAWLGPEGHLFQPRPPATELATMLLENPAFRQLQLGTWRGAVDRQLVAAAIELLTPPLYRSDAELLIEAMTIAAGVQRDEGRSKAGATVVASIAVPLILRYLAGGSEAA